MRRQSLLRRLYHFTWHYKMTPAGKVMTGLIAVSSLATVSTQVPVFQVCCALLGLLVVAEFFGLFAKPTLSVSASWPRVLVAGEVTTVSVRVSNQSSWRAAYDVMLLILDQPKSLEHLNGSLYVGKLAPKSSVEMKVQLRALRRGRLRIGGLDAHSTFPFNLIRIPGGRAASHEFVVTPPTLRLKRFDLPVETGDAAGQFVLSGQVGESTEYLGNREYAPGEPIKRLDFRAWARLGKPIIREYQDEHASRVGVFVDTITSREHWWQQPRSSVEESVTLGAAIIDALLLDDYRLAFLATATDLFTYSDETNRNHRDELMDRLALSIPSCVPVFERLLEPLLNEADRCAAIVVVLADWDAQRETFIRELAASGPPVKVVLVRKDGSEIESAEGVDAVSVAAGEIRRREVSVL